MAFFWVISLFFGEMFNGRDFEKLNKLKKYNQHARQWGECKAKSVMVLIHNTLGRAYISAIKCMQRKFNLRILSFGCISVCVEVFEQVRYYLSSDGISSRQMMSCVELPRSLPTPRYLILQKTFLMLSQLLAHCFVSVFEGFVWIKTGICSGWVFFWSCSLSDPLKPLEKNKTSLLFS